jgi:hypothetical protein
VITRGKSIVACTGQFPIRSSILQRVFSHQLNVLNDLTLKLASLFSKNSATAAVCQSSNSALSFLTARPASSRPTSQPQFFSHCTFLNFNLDCLSTSDNFKRLSKMFAQATHDELKEKMQVLKELYTSRHYTQCAKFGERLLNETNDEVCKLSAYQFSSDYHGRQAWSSKRPS